MRRTYSGHPNRIQLLLTMISRPLALTFGFCLAACRGGDSGAAMPPLKVTYMVDTTSTDRNAILKLWRDYLIARPHTYTPKKQWSDAEQKQWPIFDLAMGMVYDNDEQYHRTNATVFEISPSRPDSSEYVIRTHFTRPETATDAERTAIVRVYATRENGQWVLANALPRMTEDWKRTTFEQITYVYPPEYQVDTTRARQAVRFVDSLARMFDAPPVKQLTYYLARTPEEAFRIAGLELYIPGSRARVAVADYLLFSGVPRIGEFYAHELTHLVLGRILPQLGAPPLFDEALALWLGGGREMTYEQLVEELAGEMKRNPSWTAERLVQLGPKTFLWRNTAAAVLLAIAHDRGGVPMLKSALRSPRSGSGFDFVGGVASATGMSRPELEEAFRARITGASR